MVRALVVSLLLSSVATGCGREPAAETEGIPATTMGPEGMPPAPRVHRTTTPPGFGVEPGQGVTISGSVSYGGAVQGTIRVDFFQSQRKARAQVDGQQAQADPPSTPHTAHSIVLEEPGTWSVEAPKGYGPLMVCAFIDVDGGGPSKGEPKVLLERPLKVDDEPILGVHLEIQDNWDKEHQHGGRSRQRSSGDVSIDGQRPRRRPGAGAGTKDRAE